MCQSAHSSVLDENLRKYREVRAHGKRAERKGKLHSSSTYSSYKISIIIAVVVSRCADVAPNCTIRSNYRSDCRQISETEGVYIFIAANAKSRVVRLSAVGNSNNATPLAANEFIQNRGRRDSFAKFRLSPLSSLSFSLPIGIRKIQLINSLHRIGA